ncbi:MAG: TusE/DsrC/DsvC family sulfur relay protein [Acidobacteria bacterium]|nr:TusE/DsrC/DsvC family sulfur relay protein [Acidobacteriota bacterium]
MAEATVQPQGGALDAEGFLTAMATWDRQTAEALAKANDIGPLTDQHWLVIEYVKSYYEEHGSGPPVVKIGKATGLNAADICRLFPCGVVRGAYRLAGLPRPAGCM